MALLAQCATKMGEPGAEDDWVATGQLTMAQHPDETGPITIQSKGWNRSSEQVTLPNDHLGYVINPSEGKSDSHGASKQIPAWSLKYFWQDHVPALACAVTQLPAVMNILYVGVEQLGAASVYHIEFIVPSHDPTKWLDRFEPLFSEFHVYLDAKSFVVLKTKHFVFSPTGIENHSVWTTVYGDYRSVGGILEPFHMENWIGDGELWDIQFSSIQRNVGLSDSAFSLN